MNIIITGISKGIGKEIVKLIIENKDNKIIGISRNAELLNSLRKQVSNSHNLITIPYNLHNILSNPDELIEEINSHFIKTDILINNAGELVNKAFSETSITEAKSIFDTNFFGASVLIQKLIPSLEKSELSHVVNIGSMGGFQSSRKFPGLSYYSASKAAISCLTECLAQEYINTNIRFNCLALGAAQTEMLNHAFPGYKAPLKAEEIAKFIVEFALNGNKYFNGKTIPVSLTDPS